MTADLQPLDRLLRIPADRWHVVRHLARGALDNARASLDELSRAVTDRQELQAGLAQANRPGDLGALDAEACWERLAGRSVGRLAYLPRPGTPDLVPVNYTVEDGTILLRSAVGPKLQAAERRDHAAFEVDDIDETGRSGWSVVLVGRLELVPPSTVGAGPGPEPWATGPRRHLVRLTPDRVTGRQLLGRP